MSEDDKGHRAFYHQASSWYADALKRGRHDRYVDEVNFGIYHVEGGTSGEMAMRWHDLQSHKPPAARLECFEDSFRVLADMPDVVRALGEVDGKNIQPEEFCALLLGLGFKDETARVAPEERAEGEAARLRRVVKEIDFDGLSVGRLRRIVEAVKG